MSIGGYYRVGADIIGGNNEKDSDLDARVTGDYGNRGRLNFKAQNDDGTFGGFLRLQTGVELPVVGAQSQILNLAWAWWQPIEMLKLQAGKLDDFYVNEIIDDPFGGNAEETNVHYKGYYTNDVIVKAFAQDFSGDNAIGAALSIYPIEGLALNLSVPYIFGNLASADPADQAYSHMLGQVQYSIENVGRLSLAFRGTKGYANADADADQAAIAAAITAAIMGGETSDSVFKKIYEDNISLSGVEGDNHAIYAAFYFTMIENMGVNLGLKFTLPYSDEDDYNGSKLNYTYNAPFLIGLGFKYDLDALGFAARLGVGLGESWKWDVTIENGNPVEFNDIKVEGDGKGPTLLAVQILPSYDIGACRIHLNAGLDMWLPDEGDSELGFYINPYASKVIGGGSFFAGFKLTSPPGDYLTKDDGTKGDKKIYWSIPVGMKFSF